MRTSLLLALLAVAASAPLAAQSSDSTETVEAVALPPRTVQEGLDDLRLATAVRLALVADPRTRPLEIQVGARDGVVAVFGIEDPAYQRVAASVAREVPGVRGIQGLGDASGDIADVPVVQIPALPSVHVVERGDTLFGIARRYGVSANALRDLNNLRTDTIRIGQRLRLR